MYYCRGIKSPQIRLIMINQKFNFEFPKEKESHFIELKINDNPFLCLEDGIWKTQSCAHNNWYKTHFNGGNYPFVNLFILNEEVPINEDCTIGMKISIMIFYV